MGRPLQPSAISEAKGYYLKHKERKPKGEPVVTQPLGGPPKHLLPEEKKIWKEMAKHLPPGVAKVTDRDTFEIMVCLFTKERARTIKISERGQMLSIMSRFGMAPSDRTKVHADAAPTDELEDFLAGYTPPAPKLQ